MKTFYKDTIREVISLGGDTDTNACIVGQLIGSYVGIKNIDREMLNIFFSWNCTDKENFIEKDGKTYGKERPQFLSDPAKQEAPQGETAWPFVRPCRSMFKGV